MNHKTLRTLALAAVLATLATLPAQAGRGPKARAAGSGKAVGALLTSLPGRMGLQTAVDRAGMMIDPNGSTAPREDGMGIDPNGALAPEVAKNDDGMGIDPNG
jgi:hypothetical protein